MDPSNDRLLGAGTIWEIAIKVGLKKLNLSQPYRQWMEQAITGLGATVLPITVEHADIQAGLPLHHRDPFDRLLVAQALVENMPVVSCRCPARFVWDQSIVVDSAVGDRIRLEDGHS